VPAVVNLPSRDQVTTKGEDHHDNHKHDDHQHDNHH
jgi:hypothetical protein